MVIQGRKLSDPSARTAELPITVIQGIGKCLRDGMSMRATAREMRVAYDTVAAIEDFLGIRSTRVSKEIDIAVEAAREGSSVRTLARRLNISTGKSHRLMARAREILVELGELSPTTEGATV
jgi:transposase-like protein